MSRLGDRLRARIEREGPITFAEFMDAALYDPDDGFYARAPRIGRGGAFSTAPTVLPLFAEALASELRQLWDRLGRPAPFTVCEIGPGDGSLASGLAGALADLPLELVLCERAEGLAARQRERLPAARHVALADLAPVTGAIVANEVHDACPAHVVRWPDELRVGVDDEAHFAWVVAGAAPEVLQRIVRDSVATPPKGLELAVSPAQAELQASLARRIACGALFVFDYGEAGPERYLRPVPHLRTYLAGSSGGDPLAGPGAQDITVDVDFRAVRAAGEAVGLRTVVDEPQPVWLRRHGALDRVEALPVGSEERLWLESFARDEASGSSFRTLVQERL